MIRETAKQTVLLIDPPGWQGLVQAGVAFPNVGLAYLAAALIDAGHTATILDMNNQPQTDASILELVKTINPALIGFSIKTSTLQESRRLAELLKKQFPHILLIAAEEVLRAIPAPASAAIVWKRFSIRWRCGG